MDFVSKVLNVKERMCGCVQEHQRGRNGEKDRHHFRKGTQCVHAKFTALLEDNKEPHRADCNGYSVYIRSYLT